MGNFPPLNQSYRMEETRMARRDVRLIEESYLVWARNEVAWCPNDHNPALSKPGKIHVGRSYDCAITLASIDFEGKDVLELGARASFLSPYLTRYASSVFVTDLFGQSHEGLGDLEHWTDLWKRAAFRPERLECRAVDILRPRYLPQGFDVVICLSAIEHLTKPPDGDIIAARNMGRLCRPGGYVVISTDMAEEFRLANGYYYDEEAVWERLIRPTGCKPLGAIDLSWEPADKSPHKSGAFERTACIFVLQKPGERW